MAKAPAVVRIYVSSEIEITDKLVEEIKSIEGVERVTRVHTTKIRIKAPVAVHVGPVQSLLPRYIRVYK